jgi:hypothetical protein
MEGQAGQEEEQMGRGSPKCGRGKESRNVWARIGWDGVVIRSFWKDLWEDFCEVFFWSVSKERECYFILGWAEDSPGSFSTFGVSPLVIL